MHPARVRKWKQKHCSTLISLTGQIDFISGDKPHQGFSNTWSRFITHLFLLFVGPLSVLWPFRKLSLPPGRISFLGNCAKAVCITTLSHWTDISCYNYANSRLELYFSVWLSADMHEQKRGPCCLFSCIMHAILSSFTLHAELSQKCAARHISPSWYHSGHWSLCPHLMCFIIIKVAALNKMEIKKTNK